MFLSEPDPNPEIEALFASDVDEHGFVMNLSRLWAWQPDSVEALFELMGRVMEGFTTRQKAILVTASASSLGDSYCTLSWGTRLAERSDPGTAAEVAGGGFGELDSAERAMVYWARKVTKSPNDTSEDDIESLRKAGFADSQIFAMTAYIGLRIAFSTVNDALGAVPDPEVAKKAPAALREAVDFGRRPGSAN